MPAGILQESLEKKDRFCFKSLKCEWLVLFKVAATDAPRLRPLITDQVRDFPIFSGISLLRL